MKQEERMTVDYSARNELIDMIVPIEGVRTSTFNPRKRFDEAALQELADSIREHGLLEPIVVRGIDGCLLGPGGAAYEIVAGERRYRACKLAGLTEISVRIAELSDEQALKLAIIENIQRVDLDPIEEAAGYKRLSELGMKQGEIAAAVNRQQPTIANRMRLLDLPEDVQERITRGELSPSHGVALAKYKGFPRVASEIADLAIKNKSTSHDLEGDLPWYWILVQRGAARDLSAANFDAKSCHQCPYQAYRKAGYAGTCLKPECFDEKQAGAQAALTAKVAATVEQARVEGQELPKISDLKYETYERLGRDRPAGCTGFSGCSKAGKAIDYGGAVLAICTDPKCYRRLKNADARATNKAGRELMQEQLAALEKRIDGLSTLGPRELAILAVKALGSDWHVSQTLEETCKRQGVSELAEPLRNRSFDERGRPVDRSQDYVKLAERTPIELARVALETVMRSELRRRYQDRATSESPIADWWLAAEEPAAESPQSPAVDAPEEPPMNACGLSATHAVQHAHGTAFSCEYHLASFRQLEGAGEPQPLTLAQSGKIRCGHVYGSKARCEVCMPANCDDRCGEVE